MKLTRRFAVVAACVLAVVLCGCSGRITESTLVGTYHVKWEPYPGRNFGQETLKIKSDKTFEQVFVASSGRVSKNTGTWYIDRNPSTTIHLNDVKNYVSPNYDILIKNPQPQGEFLGIHKFGSKVYLIINDDLDLYYKKKR